MRYAQIRKYDVANGPGIRTSVFVTGCTHHCAGCFNEEYQDFEYGMDWSDKTTQELIEYLEDPNVSGLTLLGGEPFQNSEGLIPVIEEVRRRVDTNIWAYSGYCFDELMEDQTNRKLLELCDVLVDGLYVDALRDLTLRFRGSSNQRIIDVAKTIETGEIQLFME